MSSETTPQPRDINFGKYLLFHMQQEEFGIEILKVREIISAPKVVPIPKTPPHYKGVMNLRGQMIPVVDLRVLLGLPERAIDRTTCTIVVEALVPDGELPLNTEGTVEQSAAISETDHSSMNQSSVSGAGAPMTKHPMRHPMKKHREPTRIGITVDSVSEVIQIGSSDVQKLNSMSDTHWSSYLIGVAKKADRIISLINLDEILV